MQPSLDESWWKGWFGFDGPTGALFNKVLEKKADELPEIEGFSPSNPWKKATALAELAVSDEAPPAQVTVFVDAAEARAEVTRLSGARRSWSQ